MQIMVAYFKKYRRKITLGGHKNNTKEDKKKCPQIFL